MTSAAGCVVPAAGARARWRISQGLPAALEALIEDAIRGDPARRCAGSAAASAIWSRRWRRKGSRPASAWWRTCCGAEIQLPEQPQDPRGQQPSGSRCAVRAHQCDGEGRALRPASRRSRWIRRRRSWLATSRTPAASCVPRVSPNRCGCMISRSRNSARLRPMASTTSPPIMAGSVSASMPIPAAFAVESIRRWWQKLGQPRYPNARRLTITADCGGSNGAAGQAMEARTAALRQ